MEYTPKEIVDMAKGILIIITIIILMYAVLRGTASTLPSKEMTVVDCYPTENYYTVVVEDSNGDQWSYFADHYTESGIVNVLFKGDEIVDVK